MKGRIQRTFQVFVPGGSLKRRVIYALAIVRLILAPVIFLTIYYLFRMGAIVNRIVNIDAPVTTLAEQISVNMLRARRSERDYFLLQDSAELQTNRQALDTIKQTVAKIDELAPDEQSATRAILKAVEQYEQHFGTAVSLLEQPGATTAQRVQDSVAAYETDLNDLLRHAKRTGAAQLVREVQNQVQSFDAELAKILGQENPTLSVVTPELEEASHQILHMAAQLEAQRWQRVERDHREARRLLQNAEWVLSIVSAITFLLSVWISFVLPRQVVKPMLSLKEAVDHAASGKNLVELELRGEGEIIELARSIDRLIKRIP
jgi:CHASE3 domain sensor protein